MKHILISGTIHIQTDVYQKVEGEHVSISTNIGGMGYELVKVFKKINQNATLLSLIGKDEYSHQIMSTFIKQNLNHSYLKLTLEKTPRVVCIYEGNQRMASFHHNELKPVPYYEDERGLNLLGLSNALVVDSNLFSDSLIAKARQLNKKIIAYASLSLEKELKGAKKLFDQANIIWISLPNETLTPEDVINTYVFQYHQLLVISTVTDFYIFMGSTCYMTQPSESEKARDGVCDYEYFAKFIQLTISGDRPLLALYKTTNRLVDVHYPLGHTTAY